MRAVRLFRNDHIIRVFRPFWDSSRSQKFGGSSVVTKNADKTEPDPYEGNFSFAECDQYTKVTVIGAAGRVGRTLSLLLKTCPLVDHLCLFDIDKSVKGIGVDISHIDTKCCVSCVCGMRNIQKALDAPDVVIIAAGCPTSPQLNGRKLFDKNAPIVAGLSEACARFCPKACIVLITNPINSLLPVIGEVYQLITNRIPYRKLFGLTTLDVVRANTFVAEVVRKDPNSVIVPVIGGASQETIVPVISQMKPCRKIKKGEMIALTECLKRAEGNLADCQNCGTRGASSLSTAYAGFRFTSSLVMALKGGENIIECAYVKSDIIPELEYLASPLRLGVRGIEHNFGYPQLSDFEHLTLEQAAAALVTDIETGKAFVGGIGDTIRKGLVWKRLTEETKVEATKQEVDTESVVKRRRRKEKAKVEELLYPDTRGGDGRGDQRPEIQYEDDLSANLNGFAKIPYQRATARSYHTINKELDSAQERHHRNRRLERFEKYLTEDRKKTTAAPKPATKTQNSPPANNKAKLVEDSSRKSPWDTKFESSHYKLLNQTAKQKFRSYVVAKKFTPSSSVLAVEKKKEKIKPLPMLVPPAQVPQVVEEKKEEKTKPEKVEEKVEPKDDSVRYREYVIKQLQELKRENEELKKKFLAIVQDKSAETALQVQSDKLELERTKLKACWLIMSSTMDAFSNFYQKFIGKADGKLLEAVRDAEERQQNEEESEDDCVEGKEQEQEQEQETEKDEDKYYNFLTKLMEDHSESEKSRNRIRK